MKKSIYHIILVTSAAILLCSCNRFLEENPKDQVSEDQAYTTLSSLYLNAVASIYNYVGGNADSQGLQGTGRGVYDFNTFTTDEAIMPTRGGDWYDGGFWQGLFLHNWGVDNDAIQATWEYLYKVIGLSNKYIEQIKLFQQNHSDSVLPAFLAEVRAVRAMYYYYMMDLFGRVPVITSTSLTIKDVKQSERKEVFNFIVSELQECAPLLSSQHSNHPGDYYGRMTQGVAYFLLAKLALNAEVYTDNDWTDGTKPAGKEIFFTVNGSQLNAWKTTIYYVDKLAELGYTLESDYTANFAVYNETSKENIFTIPMNKMLYSNFNINLFRSRHYNHGKAYGLGGENGSSATIEALDTYGYGTSNVDPRFYLNYYADTVYDLNDKKVMLDDGTTTLVYMPRSVALDVSGTTYERTAGARMKKYAIDATATKDGKLMENDIVLFRYSDAVLMKCEALVRNGEDGDELLNLVRSRVGASSRQATLDNILAERQLELAWEGWRRQDLIRFGKFTRAYTERPQLQNESNGYTTVFPIPGKVLNMNQNLKQNLGY